jgi:hypothetical protein
MVVIDCCCVLGMLAGGVCLLLQLYACSQGLNHNHAFSSRLCGLIIMSFCSGRHHTQLLGGHAVVCMSCGARVCHITAPCRRPPHSGTFPPYKLLYMTYSQPSRPAVIAAPQISRRSLGGPARWLCAAWTPTPCSRWRVRTTTHATGRSACGTRASKDKVRPQGFLPAWQPHGHTSYLTAAIPTWQPQRLVQQPLVAYLTAAIPTWHR